ncbi:MAG: hypothetical protein Crog4KO_19190 [Crocinitomicaceae bacterium]
MNTIVNLYLIEDSPNSYDKILGTLDTIKENLKEIDTKYNCINIQPINPSALLGITSEKDCTEELKERFKRRPPHVIVLDWELYWGNDPENPNISVTFDGDQIIHFIDKETAYNPYIIFTSNRSDKIYPSVVEGDRLERLLPHTINLLRKSVLTLPSDMHQGYEYNSALEALRMGVDYALTREIKITVFDFPEFKDYEYIQNSNKKWVQSLETPFAVTGKQSRQDILVSPNEIICFINAADYYAVVLWMEDAVQLKMCHFTRDNRVSKQKLQFRLPFLRSGDFILYNERYFDSARVGKYSFSLPEKGAYGPFERILQEHVELTYGLWAKIDESGTSAIAFENINPFYDAFQAFDSVEP